MIYSGNKSSKLFELITEAINKDYPTLTTRLVDDQVYIKGTLRIKDYNNKELDGFLIEAIVPNNFPKDIPIIREIGGKIPCTPERHLDAPYGNACLEFRDAIFFKWDENCTIIDFIKKFVEPFFLWQIEYKLTGGKNKNQAFEHGVDGAIQFYSEILNTNDNKIIVSFVKYLTKKKIKGHWPCYCGSGIILRKCHVDTLVKYREKIRRKDAGRTLVDFKKVGII